MGQEWGWFTFRQALLSGVHGVRETRDAQRDVLRARSEAVHDALHDEAHGVAWLPRIGRYDSRYPWSFSLPLIHGRKKEERRRHKKITIAFKDWRLFYHIFDTLRRELEEDQCSMQVLVTISLEEAENFTATESSVRPPSCTFFSIIASEEMITVKGQSLSLQPTQQDDSNRKRNQPHEARGEEAGDVHRGAVPRDAFHGDPKTEAILKSTVDFR